MVLITVATGFVGKRLLQTMEGAVAAPSLRNADEEMLRRIVEESGEETIVHTAAVSDIGACQADPETSYRANVELPLLLAKAAGGRKLICFSSDQVYCGSEGPGPYSEPDAAPGNLYACQKLEMEQRVLDLDPDAVMLQAEWMYDPVSEKGNFYRNVLGAKGPVSFSSRRYRGVTALREVAENMPRVAELPGGVYNFGSETSEAIGEIAKRFLAALNRDTQVLDCSPGHNLWMNCEKAHSHGIVFSDVLTGLLRCAASDPGLTAEVFP